MKTEYLGLKEILPPGFMLFYRFFASLLPQNYKNMGGYLQRAAIMKKCRLMKLP